MRELPLATLQLTEYQTTEGVYLTAEQRDLLRKTVPDLTISPTPGQSDAFDIRPQSWIGTCQLPDLNVIIRPKLPINRVLFMLSYNLNLLEKRQNPTDFYYGEADELIEVLAYAFGIAVGRSLTAGLLQGYQTREEALQGVRGRLRFDEQLRTHFFRFPPVECRYDEYTVDITENQIIKAALAALGRIRIRSLKTRRTLRVCSTILAPVSNVEFHPMNLPVVHYSRLNDRYRPALELSKLILRSVSFQMVAGRSQATTILFDMNKVFEGFLVRSLREELRLTEREFPQNCCGRQLWLDDDRRQRLEPDFSWWRDSRCLLIGDAKYKDLANGAPADDVYQGLAYCVAANLSHAFFVYAAGAKGAQVVRISQAGKQIMLLALNLDANPRELLAQIRELAVRLREGIASPVLIA